MKRWFFAVLFLIAITTPWAVVQAQTPLEIDQLQIDIWPEYDKPSVLVIYHMKISANTTMPAQVTLRIPKAANGPSSVAYKDVDGLLYNVPHNETVSGNWVEVSFTAPSSELQFEYYDPALVIDGATHNFSYHWPGDYRVQNLTFRIQQPVNSSNMHLTNSTLKMDNGSKGDDGLTYFIVPIDGPIDAGMTFDVPFSYTKSDSTLSASNLQPIKTPPNNPVGSSLAPTNNMVWIGLGAGGVLVLIGLLWYLNQQKMNPISIQNARRRHTTAQRPRARERQPVSANRQESVYCSQCGKRAGPGDAFCRSCGSRLND